LLSSLSPTQRAFIYGAIIGFGAAIFQNLWIQISVDGLIYQLQARVLWSLIGVIITIISVFALFGTRLGSSPTRGGLAGFAVPFSIIYAGITLQTVNVLVAQGVHP
jgi:hypothetical protein